MLQMSGKGSKQRPTDKKKFDENYDRIFSKTSKYEDLETCIKSDQVPANEVAELFKDKSFYDWYAKRNFKK